MRIASVNVRGLMGRLEKRHEARNVFLDFVRTENPDVVVVCEAWLAVGKNGWNIQDV
jgi:exonuclease III